jgi:hypothetical protein
MQIMYKFSAKKYLNANFKNPKLEPFIGYAILAYLESARRDERI